MRKLVTAAALLIAVVTGAVASQDKTPDISTIMKKLNGKAKGLHGKAKVELNAASQNWEDLAKLSKEYRKLAESLGKNDPPKGEKASWEKLTKQYVDNVKKLDEAIGKKDKDAALKAHGAISKSCKACHDAHQDR